MRSIEDIRKRLAELNHAIKVEGIELDVLPGMEISFDPLIPDLLDKGRLLTLGKTSYVLIETPFQQLPLGWEQVVFAILSKGYLILMAHPERCAQLAAKPGPECPGLVSYLQQPQRFRPPPGLSRRSHD